jgi:Cu(I)/Ag(I) efflux system membrane protein CusA/SilA
MKPIAAPIVGGMVTSTIHVLILVPVFFALMKERALRYGTLRPSSEGRQPAEGSLAAGACAKQKTAG